MTYIVSGGALNSTHSLAFKPQSVNHWVCASVLLFSDDSLKYVTIIPVGSRVPESDIQATVSLMQSSCEPTPAKFMYRSIMAPEAEKLLCSIHKKTTTQPAPTAMTTTALTQSSTSSSAARILIARQQGGIVTLGAPLKIIVSSPEVLRSLSNCMQVDGRDEENEMDDRSRSPSPPHPIFSGPVVRYSECDFYSILLRNNHLPIRYRHRQSGSTAYRLQAAVWLSC